MFSLMSSFGFGVYMTSKGYLSIGMLIASIQILNSIFHPISRISNYRNLIKTCKNIIGDYDSKLKINIESFEKINQSITEISLENISLDFNDKIIFNNFNKTFKSNNKYELVGQSGKGKSSLAKLIMNYCKKDMYSGNIKINYKTIDTISPDYIYSKIAYIQKNDFILDSNIKDNILLGREKPINFYSTLKKLNIDKIIDKDDNNLSHGEKQRIDISRFIINDYDLYIFDEPTSNLDTETSMFVYDYIFSLNDKLVIVITHDNYANLLDKFNEVIRI